MRLDFDTLLAACKEQMETHPSSEVLYLVIRYSP